jgi:hypothetical protein
MRHALSSATVPAFAALAFATIGGGCAGAGPRTAAGPEMAAHAPDPCASPAAAAPRDTVSIAFDRTVNPDRLIARQLASSAGAADCAGQARDSGAYDLLRRGDTLFGVPRRAALPVLRISPIRAGDARDLLDTGADLVVTRDERAIAYARSRADFAPIPLAWDRIYVLVSPSVLPAASLRDAVRADARTPVPPFWWTGDSLCTDGFNGTNQRRTRLVVSAGDPVARDLATRIVAAAPGLVVAAVDSAELGRALDRGMDAGYLLALPPQAPGACPVTRWPAGWQAAPLIETRAYAIIRQGTLRISTDADGLFRIVAPAP